jgi:hypothetical protein
MEERTMRYAMWLGCLWLGASMAGCATMSRDTPLLDEKPVGASSGNGGGAIIDTGRWATVERTQRTAHEQRHLYAQVEKELGLDEARVTADGMQLDSGEAVGGGGRAGGERRSCAEVLATDEPASVVSGRLDFAMDGVLTVNVPGRGPVKLRADESTCAVQAGQLRPYEALQVGTDAQVSYVMENGLPTARIVRAEPLRFTN